MAPRDDEGGAGLWTRTAERVMRAERPEDFRVIDDLRRPSSAMHDANQNQRDRTKNLPMPAVPRFAPQTGRTG